jgi:c(7)-type cytochrome triheme protein
MRSLPVVVLTSAVLVGGAALVQSVEAQKIPPPLTFDVGTGSPGPVTFSHDTHKEANEKCTVCHTKIFKMKKGTTGPLTMAKMEAGEQCGVCHNGKTEVKGQKIFGVSEGDTCVTCHKPK